MKEKAMSIVKPNEDSDAANPSFAGVDRFDSETMSYDWHQALLDAVLEGVIVIDKQGQIKYVNHAAKCLFGYSVEELLGVNVSRLMPEPYTSEHDQYLQNYLLTGVKRIIGLGREVTGLRKDGSTFQMNLTLTEFVSKGDLAFIGVLRDITQQQQISEKLRLSEIRNKAVIHSCLDAVITIDHVGRVCDSNPSAEQLFGYRAEEITGRLMSQLLIPERFREVYQQSVDNYSEKADSEIFLQRVEWNALHRDGHEFPAEFTITPMIYDEGVFFTVFIRDISESKQAQVLLRQSLKEVEMLNLMKSQVLATMSHEIRTPLNAILGAQELLAETQLNELQRSYWKMANDAGNSLFALVKDMIDLVKVEANKLVLDNQIFDLSRLLDELLHLTVVSVKGKNIQIHKEIAPEVALAIYGDSWRLRQVLLHLMANAVKFTPSGEVLLRVSLNPGDKEQGLLLFEVIDNGVGIDQEVQKRLFQPFIQADLSDTRKYGGSGLGLAIVRGLVRLWNGKYGLESQLGQGSRFWFTFGHEVVDGKIPLDYGEFVQPPSSPASAKILLVEDSPTNQAVLSAMLRKAGHQVEVVDNGVAAINAVQANRYDVVLMDVAMPEMDGIEATLRIRALSGAAAIVPIIAMTAHAFEGYRERCLAVGMNDFATKPISKQHLLDLVGRWCGEGVLPQSLEQFTQSQAPGSQWLDDQVLLDLSVDAGIEDISPLIDIFIDELLLRQSLIKDAIENQSLSVLAQEVHVLKSTAATFGAKPLRAFATECNDRYRKGDADKAWAVAHQLLPCLESTIKALQAKKS